MNFFCSNCQDSLTNTEEEICDACQRITWMVQWAPRATDFLVHLQVKWYGPEPPTGRSRCELVAEADWCVIGVRDIVDGVQQPMRNAFVSELGDINEHIYGWLDEDPLKILKLASAAVQLEYAG